MTAPARTAAHAVLREVHTGRADLPQAQARARASLTDPRDRALAAEIATGTLRMRGALDCVLQDVSSRPLDAVHPELLDVLRAAAYQLLYLDRVPSHAVVHDAVALTRSLGTHRSTGFVNAVLRALTRTQPRTRALPARPETTRGTPDRRQALDYLAVTQSHPRWLVERWLDRYGFESAERWVSFNNTPAPVTLRVNTLKSDRASLLVDLKTHGVEVVPGQWSPRTLITTGGNPLATPLADTGRFLVQDEASQLVAEVVAATGADRVFDACASPGGKTVAIAGAMRNTGLLVAADLRPRRLSLLAKTLSRCGCRNTRIVCCDVGLSLPFRPDFDWVLLDAPCSGLGTLRRDPDIRWRRRPDDLTPMAAAQTALLAAAATVVSPTGRLVYATCSSEPEENQQVVERFLTEQPTFTVERPPSTPSPLVDPHGYFQTLPHRDGLEAFFAVVLRRHDRADMPRAKTPVRYT